MVDLSPRAHKAQIIAGLMAALLIFAALVAIPYYSEKPLNQLEAIQQRGELRVLTLNAASTYYEDANGLNGFEYHLAKLFADHIGVSLSMIVVHKFADLYPELLFDSADMAAAGLSKLDAINSPYIGYGPAYHQVSQQVVYRKGELSRPKSLNDLDDGTLEVIAGTSHARLLMTLQKDYPDLSWSSNRDIATEELIELVEEGLIDYILADSHEIALQRRFYPELRIAFELGKPKLLRWAFKKSPDKSLLKAMESFFETIKQVPYSVVPPYMGKNTLEIRLGPVLFCSMD